MQTDGQFVLLLGRSAFLAMLESQNLSLSDLATFQDKVTAVLLQSIILKSYDIKALATAKDLPSALSSVEGKPFPLTFGKNGSSVRLHTFDRLSLPSSFLKPATLRHVAQHWDRCKVDEHLGCIAHKFRQFPPPLLFHPRFSLTAHLFQAHGVKTDRRGWRGCRLRRHISA